MRTLAGKTVLITGAGSGIGRDIALESARRGARVVATDLNEPGAGATADMVRAAAGRAIAYGVDVTSHEQVRDLCRRLTDDGVDVDVLVNNAGVVHGGAFLDVPLERHLATYRVNTLGVVTVTHALLPSLLLRPEAHLVFLASAAGFVGLPYGSTYASSKWSVIGLAESIRLELAEQGHTHVRVTTICPSFVTTGMFDGVAALRLTRPLAAPKLARMVVRAILTNRPYVLTPWLVRLTPFLRGALPLFASDALARLFGVTRSMESWKGRIQETGDRRQETD
jgi:short-subunit dehydrogenase